MRTPGFLITHLRWSNRALLSSVESNARTFRPEVRAFIPDFDGVDYTVVTSKIDISRHTARGNSLSDLDLFTGTVVKVNNNVTKFDWRKIDFKLKSVESAIRLSDFYLVVIGGSVDVGLAKIGPTSRICSDR